MPIYTLAAWVTVSASVVVEANDEKEARRLAAGLPVVLHLNGSSYGEGEAWAIEEADGEAFDIAVIHVSDD